MKRSRDNLCLDDNTMWPDASACGVEYRLRYGAVTTETCLRAAQIVAAYQQLTVTLNTKDAIKKLRMFRKARRNQ